MQPISQASALRGLQNNVLPHLPTDISGAGGSPFIASLSHLPILPSIDMQQKQNQPASNGAETGAADSSLTTSLPHLPSLPTVDTQQKKNQTASNGADTSAVGSPPATSLPHLPSFLPSSVTQQKQNQDPSASTGAVGGLSISSLPHLPSLPSAVQDLQEKIISHLPGNCDTNTGSPSTIYPLPSLLSPSRHSFRPSFSSLSPILHGLYMVGKAAKIAKNPAKMLALPKQLIGHLQKFFTSQPLGVKLLLLLSGLVLLSAVATAILVSAPVLIVLSLLLAPAFAAVTVAATGFVLALGFSVAMAYATVWAYKYTTSRSSASPARKLDFVTMALAKKAEDVRKR